MNTATTLSAFWQEVYSSQVVTAYPDFAYVMKNVKFSGKEASQGGEYIQPVVMGREHGWTYAPANTGPVTGVGPKAATQTKAKIQGAQLFGQGSLDYEAAARAEKGKASFIDATENLFKNLVESGAFRQELQFLYGGSGLGAVNAATTAVNTLSISAATWNMPTWSSLIGASISILSSDLGTLRGTRTVTNVDIDSTSGTFRTVTFDGAALTLTAGDLVFFETAADATVGVREALGLDKILTTTTGNLFGVNVGTYPLWRPQTYAVGGALTATKILAASLLSALRGNKEDLELWCSVSAFQGLVNPLIDPTNSVGARKIDASYSGARMELGTNSVVLHAQGFKVKVVPHMLVRDGEAFLLPVKKMKRIGASELSFKTPGRGDEIFVHSPTTFSYELRCYANQALFVEAPGRCVKLTGIT